MKISQFDINGNRISIANDARHGEPDCWKTKVGEGMWSPGHEDLGAELSALIDHMGHAHNDANPTRRRRQQARTQTDA